MPARFFFAICAVVVASGCTRERPPSTTPASATVLDAGPWVLTEERLTAWLQYAEAALTVDAGSSRERAKADHEARATAGLADDEVPKIEAVVAAVVAQRSLERLTAAEAMKALDAAPDAVDVDDAGTKVFAQVAKTLADLKAARPSDDTRARLDAEYGADAVARVLAREAALTRAWERLSGLR